MVFIGNLVLSVAVKEFCKYDQELTKL